MDDYVDSPSWPYMRIQNLAFRESSYRKYIDCCYHDSLVTEGEVFEYLKHGPYIVIGRLVNRIAALECHGSVALTLEELLCSYSARDYVLVGSL